MQLQSNFPQVLWISCSPLTEFKLCPQYQTPLSSALDLCAALETPYILKVGARVCIDTGWIIILPSGHEGQIRSRSGWALKQGIVVLNGVGTIDEDYRGEIKVLLINLGQEDVVISHEDRIAQLVIQTYVRCHSVKTSQKTLQSFKTERGTGGFGSTGN
jgi:dUTP pyrophosphatase